MAKSRKQAADQQDTTTSGNGSQGGKSEGPTISKVDALTEAVQQLGQDAANQDLADYIRNKYGDQALPSNFSVTKSTVMKKLRQGGGGGRGKGRRGGRRQAAAQPAAAPRAAAPAPSFSPRGGGISLDDLRQLKELAGRYGKDQIKEVLDLLA